MSDWKQYRKTEPIEAMLIEGPDDVPEVDGVLPYQDGCKVATKEGALWPSYPFYLCRDVEDDVYPVSVDVFQRTYEEVEQASDD